MREEELMRLPRKNEVDRTGETKPDIDYSAVPKVSDAVKRLMKNRPPLRANGLFIHPPDFTPEEVAFIADGLRENVPIVTLAKALRCESWTLSKFIRKQPDLVALKEAQKENIYEQAFYQADKLAKAGNASVVMFILERMGKDKGWSNLPSSVEKEGEEEGKIIMGIIPDEEVKAAAEKIKSIREADEATMESSPTVENKVFESNPIKMALAEEKAAEEMMSEREKAARKMVDDAVREAQGVVSPAPYSNDTSEIPSGAPFQMVSQAGGLEDGMMDEFEDGGRMGMSDDPWAAGSDSVFNGF